MQKILNVIMVISLAFSLLICFYKVAGDKSGNDTSKLTNPETSSIQVKAGGDGVRPELANAASGNSVTEKQPNNRIGG